jgi:Putative Actinobacterial Holin-X, holin superfamily III
MADQQTSELAQAIQEVTEKASLLVREEIELAKAEMTEKMMKLARGAAIGGAAGVFVIAALIYAGHALSWGIWALIGGTRDFWLGFAIVAAVLFVLAGIAGLIAARAFKKGSPPAPTMAIEEAQLIRETVTSTRPATPLGPAGSTSAPRNGGRS